MRKVLIYTVHKAASVFLHQVASEVSQELCIDHHSVNSPLYDTIMERSWKGLIEDDTKTGCFGPIRALEAMPNIPDNPDLYAVILHLRDPRDVVTSLFFSYLYSHPRSEGRYNPSADLLKQWEDEGIDAFVIKNIPTFKQRYGELCSSFFGRENVVFLKYEDMVTNYSVWLDQFLSAFSHFPFRSQDSYENTNNVTDMTSLHQKIYEKHKDDFAVSSEDVYAHKRQVMPGDYERKLRRETIVQLNREFRDILDLLQYPYSRTLPIRVAFHRYKASLGKPFGLFR